LGWLNTRIGVPPAPYRRHRAAWRRGRYDWVATHTAAVLADLGPDAAADRWGPGVVARHGMALARRQHYPAARAELRRALKALPGSMATADLGPGDQVAVALLEVLVVLGDLADATALATRLRQHGHHPATTLAAERTLARLHLAAGDIAGAHRWLDEAASVAQRIGGDVPLALVHADRAVVVAGDDRFLEALAMAPEALDRLAATVGAAAQLSAEQGAITAAAVALAAADHHPAEAGRLAERAMTLASAPDRPVTTAFTRLAVIATMRAQGNESHAPVDLATGLEAAAQEVVDTLATAGAEPLRALAVREQALAAAAAGHQASAVALAAHAVWAFERLELPVELARSRQLLEQLGD
jgi:tetratricopeptide (TPR) repeat protein